MHSSTVNEKLLSPMMLHYVQTKRSQPAHLLLYRVGDFYEAFFEDAAALSDMCDIALTSKDAGRSLPDRVPMAGVPHHALDSKLRMLLAKGASVAVADQVGPVTPGPGLVERRVTRILTPGTLADTEFLPSREAAFLVAVHAPKKAGPISVAVADVSTGQFRAGAVGSIAALVDCLARERPAEVVASASEAVLDAITAASSAPLRNISAVEPVDASALPANAFADHVIAANHPGTASAEPAASLLLQYLASVDTSIRLEPARPLDGDAEQRVLQLDAACVRNMELISSMRAGDSARSLLAAVDRAVTPMGGRAVRAFLLAPLREVAAIRARHAVVQCLVDDPGARAELRGMLRPLADIERLAGRVAAERASPRNVRQLAEALAALPAISAAASKVFDGAGDELQRELPSGLVGGLVPPDGALDVAREALRMLTDPAPATLVAEAALTGPLSSLGGVEWAAGARIIADGVDDELDRLRAQAEDPGKWTAAFEAAEQARTGLPSLRVRHVRRSGYVVRVPRAAAMRLLEADASAFSRLGYERVQSTKAELRFRSAHLASLERDHHSALANVLRRELGLFCDLRARMAAHVGPARAAAAILAELDVLAGFAEVSAERGYARPEMLPAGARSLEVTAARHAVVEQGLPVGSTYVANSLALGGGRPDAVVLCGPNAAGKSCAIRAVALCVILAQAGCFVAADGARLSVCDRVLTRVGAVDDVAADMSSFQVEMAETASILSAATGESLVLLDEIGRGTGVVDGIGVACAVAESLALRQDPPRTLFVTHYHELNVLAQAHGNIAAMAMQVVDGGEGRHVATHRVVEGAAWASLGVDVARRAGFPDSVVQRAEEVAEALRAPARALGKALRNEFDSAGGTVREGVAGKDGESSEAYERGFLAGQAEMRRKISGLLGDDS